jgi:hypothetical protein
MPRSKDRRDASARVYRALTSPSDRTVLRTADGRPVYSLLVTEPEADELMRGTVSRRVRASLRASLRAGRRYRTWAQSVGIWTPRWPARARKRTGP